MTPSESIERTNAAFRNLAAACKRASARPITEGQIAEMSRALALEMDRIHGLTFPLPEPYTVMLARAAAKAIEL